MPKGILPFDVTGLDVTVNEGVKIKWEGREIDSGPLAVTLGKAGSGGVINYDTGNVEVEFRVKIAFPEFTELLQDMGVAPALLVPVDAVIKSHGVVFEDHSFRLEGKAVLDDHPLFKPDQTTIDILAPTKCKPDVVSRSGPEIYRALTDGESVSWNFNPAEKRVVVTLPEALCTETQKVCLAGYYTFTKANPAHA